MGADQPLVLGIETSCDETGVGLVRGETLLVDAIASSVDEHARFGGVVPEVASRAHLEAMVPTIERACETATGYGAYHLRTIRGLVERGSPGRVVHQPDPPHRLLHAGRRGHRGGAVVVLVRHRTTRLNADPVRQPPSQCCV